MSSFKRTLLIAIILTNLCWIRAFTFEDPEEDGLAFGSYASNTQTVEADENNNGGRMNVVKITGASGAISIETQTTNNQVFSPKVVQTEDVAYIETNRVDYEALGSMTQLVLAVTDTGDDSKQTLLVKVRNLDDESPIITADSTCSMKENEDITIDNSNCTYTVTDRDGFLDDIKFTIKESNIPFEFQYKTTIDPSPTTATVYLILETGQKLDYETQALYAFTLEATDSGNNPSIPPEVRVIVQIEDMPDEPPVWDSSFRSALTIDEETDESITVTARDGDYGIDSPITYSVQDDSGYISIDPTTGEITIKAIDRDAGHDQIKFTVTATEDMEPHDKTDGIITLIINDIDDNIPEISVINSDGGTDKKIDEEIPEGSSEINIDIEASDIDLGENAIYTAELTADNPEFLDAFAVIPSRGYEKTSLVLTIKDPSKLDYESDNGAWINITMQLVTKGTKSVDMTDSIPITIILTDWNDETPTFAEEEYKVSVPEDVEKDYELPVTIQATDKDAEDIELGLSHKLLGTMANNILIIEELGGKITTKVNDAFDFEKQTEVIIQITATDNAKTPHTASTQLTITVTDVNDENPRMTISSTIEVEENSPDGYDLNASIKATDDDTTANLTFRIDWSKSYATKNSQRLKDETFAQIQCIDIETVSENGNNQASAKLTLKETQPGNTPNFEVFDNLYLYVEVQDLNTEKNTGIDSAYVVINVLDINDNEPKFAEGTETTSRQVIENSESGTLISSVVATDADVGTELTYFIESIDDTPEWVTIDNTGSLYVSLRDGEKLDCDEGPIYSLNYKITVTDGEYNVSTSISITVIDVNDNPPVVADQSGTIQEDNGLHPDNTTPDGTQVLEIKYTDADRDEAYHTVECRFGTDTSLDVAQRFSITNNSINVQLSQGTTLDAEQNRNFIAVVTCVDDPYRQGSFSYSVDAKMTIVLTDINDNYPTITNTKITGLSENSKGIISETLKCEDADDGNNGLVNYVNITKVQRFLDENREDGEDITEKGLFDIAFSDMEATLTIKTENLREYYGDVVLTISLTDLGEQPLTNQVDVTLQIQKYNFEEPIFSSPSNGETYYLSPNQEANKQLLMWNQGPFTDIEVDDQQKSKYEFKFTVENNDENDGIFAIRNAKSNTAQLIMSTIPEDLGSVDYTVTIRATINADNIDNNEASYSKDCTFTIKFFDSENTDPVFEINEGSVSIAENLKEFTYQIPNATYPDVIDEEITKTLKIFYYLKNGNDDYVSKFKIDKESGQLALLQPLDYENIAQYTLTIQSSRDESLHPEANENTLYSLTVNVQDVNDLPPVFGKEKYTGVLNVAAGNSDINIVQVSATDIDTTSQGKLVYSITSVTGSNDALNTIISNNKNPFEIGPSNGIIKPSTAISSTFSGYFTVIVKVEDEDKFSDEAEVTIYLVTTENIVAFTFGNTQTDVASARDEIKQILDEQFKDRNYIANVDTVRSGDDETETTIQNVYFVDSTTQAPVLASDIYKDVTNVNVYKELRKKFLDISLDLQSFASETDQSADMETILKAWLIGVSVVLGSLCMILLIAFVLKTRSLNQRINKLSNTKFGSQESGLNRAGVTAPTTNKHAVEGSNPVYNNEIDTKDIDRRSVTSGDSDLIGVEDDDKFSYNRFNNNYSGKDNAGMEVDDDHRGSISNRSDGNVKNEQNIPPDYD